MENKIINFYNNYNEDKRLSRKSRMPEYITTMRYIEKYLTPNAKILEIGAGTGRYSISLAEKGYDVTAVELVPHNIKIMKKKIKPNLKINIYEGNACSLSFLNDNTYDIVLLLGPMYHLFTDEDKHNAMGEAIRVAKHGGIIYAAYCNNDTCMYKMFYKRRILSYLKKGLIDKNYHAISSPNEVFELYRKPDIDALMKDYNVTRLHFVGVDMLSYMCNNDLDKLNEKEFNEYMKFLSTICEREDMVGLSIHMLDIFKKD
ncbi:MAG: class I SAM-dependent methyltransferase [Clostridium sp.]|nr:class I SAM-dependent methyltransferase [Clostridium sp.]